MKNKNILIALFIGFGLFFTSGASADSTVNLTIRDGNNVVYAESVPLKPAGTIQLNGHDLDADSVLSVLNDADISSDKFAITDLQYYEGMGFYLKCINDKCENWQYTVNNSYSKKAMDKNVLSGGEDVYVYFGSRHRISLGSSSITTDDSLTVNGEDYLYQNNSWGPLSGVTIGVTQPDPNNPWTPIEIQTKLINDGSAVFTSLPVGSYNVGIKEDDYWPTENLTVTEAVHESHGSSGSYIANFIKTIVAPKTFSKENALKFLEQNQKVDGSFGDSLYTDWAALAATAGESKEIKDKLIKYYKENNLESNIITDNERRAMALMALGINPYTDTKINYIKKIVESFDGEQFGDNKIENDDIFALIVLKNAGYSANDEIINKDIKYLIAKQGKDGSWGSIDMTAAYVEAMKNFENIIGVSDSVLKSKNYIISNQKADGGFENSSSTSWALQSLYDNEKILKGEAYLASKQEADGGLESVDTDINTRIWATSYAIPAVLHKSWNEILQKFPKSDFTNTSGVEVVSVHKNLKTKKVELSKEGNTETKISDLGIIQQDIVKKVTFPTKLNTFWVNTKHSFRWLLDKFSF